MGRLCRETNCERTAKYFCMLCQSKCSVTEDSLHTTNFHYLIKKAAFSNIHWHYCGLYDPVVGIHMHQMSARYLISLALLTLPSQNGIQIESNGKPFSHSRVVERYVPSKHLVSPCTLLTTKGIVWTIFFHRLFGPITPTTNEFLDVIYPMAADQPELDSTIDQKVDELLKTHLVAQAQAPLEGVLVILFMDENHAKAKKKSGWFGHITEGKQESYSWESWVIRVQCTAFSTPEHLGNDVDAMFKPSIASFEENMYIITSLVDRHKDHIPPIMTLDVAPFPYKIEALPKASAAHKGSTEDDSWSHYIKKMID